jgi:3-isopropylmalate/(R)-2-methylmalate dehydratase large subunit
MFVVGGDSHSPTAGAHGAFVKGIGATEMCGVLVTGEIWVRVPATVLVRWDGNLPPGVAAKDMMLALCRDIDMRRTSYLVVEYAGPAVVALPMHERMVLTNMAAELGAKTGIIAADASTRAAIMAAGGDIDETLSAAGDPDAQYEDVLDYDAGALSPLVAAPHSPSNVHPADGFETVTVNQAYIGACTGAKLSDLHMAAEVLKGRRVATGTRLLVAPASTRTTAAAAADGTLATLTEAGAILMASGCGACAGYGAGVLAAGEVCVSTTARNFKGRMGSLESEVYLGSPYTVAASAVAGRVADPREFLEGAGT